MAFAEDYVDVATRIVEFRSKYPEGSLQPVDPGEPVKVITIGEKTFLQYVAAAYRGPDDAHPGIGVAWEPFPGRTPYTRDSEAMVAETSAWGRAIVAALAADTKKGIASADEVRVAQERHGAPGVDLPAGWQAEVDGAASVDELTGLYKREKARGALTPEFMSALSRRKVALNAVTNTATPE